MRICLLTLLLFLSGCQAERDYSGRWQLSGGDCIHRENCDGFVYELHLGRYGDGLTGVVVRYLNQGEGNSFERSNECGCFLIKSGRATEDDLRFQIHRPDLPGNPEGVDASLVCTPIPPDPCERIFILHGEDEFLTGEMRCGEEDPNPIEVTFKESVGTPRTLCLQEDP